MPDLRLTSATPIDAEASHAASTFEQCSGRRTSGSVPRLPLWVVLSRVGQVAFQLAIVGLSATISIWLAYGDAGRNGRLDPPLALFILGLACRAASFWFFGLFDAVWRYTGVREFAAILAAVATSTVGTTLAAIPLGLLDGLPATYFVIDAVLVALLLSAARFLSRLPGDRRQAMPRRRVLVIGAGDAGAMILQDMLCRADSPYEPVGVIDDDRAKHGLRVHGVRVVGGRDRVGEHITRLAPDEILIAIPSASLVTLRGIIEALHPFEIPIKTLPGLKDLRDCHVELTQIRTLVMEDLLARPAVGIDTAPVRALVEGRRVLVTGAGGSIGSELCRQILRWRPASLVLAERHENALFWLLTELRDLTPAGTQVVPALVDITNEPSLDRLFEESKPHLVFHAAAHKHVPMLELHVAEAIRNNVLGTLNAARAAERYGVERFVLISTDKAVAPVSVMGATKRLCELIVQVLMKNSPTRFCAVRFGNVLGSNGSVTQLFVRQIRAGGPLTVTHPDMRRYFMLISEAVELVQQAAVLAEPGAIYVLHMGEPIKIVDMARQLIRVAGYRPDVDVAIEFTGLRPGERLEESLLDDSERAFACVTAGLLRIDALSVPERGPFLSYLDRLRHAVTGAHASVPAHLLFDVLAQAEGRDSQRPTGTG